MGEWRAGWTSAVHTGGALRAPTGLGCGGPESPPRRSGWNLTTWYSAAGSDGGRQVHHCTRQHQTAFLVLNFKMTVNWKTVL